MSTPVNEQVIDALVARLTGLPTTGSNVSREPKYAVQTVPCLVICEPDQNGYTEDPVDFPSPCLLDCTQRIEVRIYVKQTSDAAGTRSQIRYEVENAIAGDLTLGGVCRDLRPASRPWQTGESTDSDRPVAIGVLTLQAQFFVRENARHIPL